MKKNFLILIALCMSFSTLAQDTEPPTAPSSLILWSFLHRNITVIWYEATDNVAVTEYEIYLNDTLYQTVAADGSNPQNVSYDNVPNGEYCFKVLAKDAAGNVSGFSNEECRTVYELIYETPPTTEIYLSGMLNYSGDTKAIEIKNFTSSLVDLANYELRLSSNGSGTWDTTYSFPTNTSIDPSGYTFIIANPNTTICADIVDDYNSSITNFDGNDVLGLFKNNVLIDVIGNLGSSQNFINIGETYTRLYVVNPIPSTTFEINEWHLLLDNGNNVCPGWGYNDPGLLSTKDVQQHSFQIYPNPVNGNTVFIDTKNDASIAVVRIYDISGKKVLEQTNVANQIDVQQLQQGMYIMQVEIGNEIVTKKLIKQ